MGNGMFVVMVSSEYAPVAQAGGLGEAVSGLTRELALRGHVVDVIIPKYDGLQYGWIDMMTVAYENLQVPWRSGKVPVTVWTGLVRGQRCFFIDPHSADGFFQRPSLYGSPDDVARFAFFSKAALEFMLQTNRRPDVIHCHDWQTALVPILLFEIYKHAGMPNQRVCFTIHNFSQQGVAGEWVLWACGLERPEYFLTHDRLRDDFNHSAVNLLRGGIVYSNFITTVSPQHAWETQHTDQGLGLSHTLNVHNHKYRGVLNGIDYDVWNPEIDNVIPSRFSPSDLDRKYVNKQALRDRFWLRQDYKPVIAYVGRLDRQKGVHLIRHALSYALGAEAQFVLLGTSPEPAIQDDFTRLKQELNDNQNCHLELSFNHESAHLIYAGADLLVVPSMFEPCGLAQLIALKYGTVPVVRHIGGLVNTVHDRDHSNRSWDERNGYVFHQVDKQALESALNRAIRLWFDYPEEFHLLMRRGMSQNHSWERPGEAYLQIYEQIRHKQFQLS
jgi:starch synthase